MRCVGRGKIARKNRKLDEHEEEDVDGTTTAEGMHLTCCIVYMIPANTQSCFYILLTAHTESTRRRTRSQESEADGRFEYSIYSYPTTRMNMGSTA
jgi:hypothetical protein